MKLSNFSTTDILNMTYEERLAVIVAMCTGILDSGNYVAVDFETTGFSSDASIMEAAFAVVGSHPMITQGETTLYHKFFIPYVRVNPAALKVHGITRGVLAKKGATMWCDTDVETINELVGNRYIIQWGAGYDERVWKQTMIHLYGTCTGAELEAEWFNIMYEFALLAAVPTKSGIKATTKLADAVRTAGLVFDSGEAHGALYDAYAVVRLIEHYASLAPVDI